MIGEIRMFGGNFAPRAWAFCDGQLLPISQNTALFSILGTIYGGDGRTTFALPDVRGRAALHPGHGPGLPDYRLGEKGGHETTTMTVATMPSHTHNFPVPVSNDNPITTQAQNFSKFVVIPADPAFTARALRYSSSSNTTMHPDVFDIGQSGGGQAYNNMMPWAAVNYIICMQGVFPSRG